MSEEEARTVGLRALAFVAAQESLLERFLSLSGMTLTDLRSGAEDPATLLGVLDFLLAHEPDLTAFCQRENLAPALPAAARARLAGEGGEPEGGEG